MYVHCGGRRYNNLIKFIIMKAHGKIQVCVCFIKRLKILFNLSLDKLLNIVTMYNCT